MTIADEWLFAGAVKRAGRVILAVLIGISVVSICDAQQGGPKTKAQLDQLIYSVKGGDLYRAHCAPCHGATGKGDGPMTSVMKMKMPDLTALAKNNGGQFPAANIRKTITGDDVIASHGSREMPIWGPIFHQVEDDRDYGNVRIQNLVNFLQSIQVK